MVASRSPPWPRLRRAPAAGRRRRLAQAAEELRIQRRTRPTASIRPTPGSCASGSTSRSPTSSRTGPADRHPDHHDPLLLRPAALQRSSREARSVRATSGGASLRVSLDTKATYRAADGPYAGPLLPPVAEHPHRVRAARRQAAFDRVTSGSARPSRRSPRGAWGDARAEHRPDRAAEGLHGPRLRRDPARRPEEDDRVLLTSGTIADPGGVVRGDHRRPADRPDPRCESGRPTSPIVVQAWPEDTAWRDQVRRVLEDGRAGAPGPHRARLAGRRRPHRHRGPYARCSRAMPASTRRSTTRSGSARTSTPTRSSTRRRTRGSTQAFVDERWIVEGLAEEYAAACTGRRLRHRRTGRPRSRQRPTTRPPFRLDDWPPARSHRRQGRRGHASDYGYAASWTVIRGPSSTKPARTGCAPCFARHRRTDDPRTSATGPRETAGRRTGLAPVPGPRPGGRRRGGGRGAVPDLGRAAVGDRRSRCAGRRPRPRTTSSTRPAASGPRPTSSASVSGRGRSRRRPTR